MVINIFPGYSQLGRRTLSQLLDLGINANELVASVRNLKKADFLAEKGIKISKADYDDKSTLIDAFKDTDVLVLIPTLGTVEERIPQQLNAIEAAKEAGVKRVVFISFITTSIESVFKVNPFYLFAESELRLSGLDWTIIRDGLYLDSVVERVDDMLKTGEWIIAIDKGKVSYISKDDLARAIALICLNSGHSQQTYILTGAKAYSMQEIIEIISKVLSKSVKHVPISEEVYIQRARNNNRDEYMIGVISSLYRAIDKGEVEKVTNHFELITGEPPEHPESYFRRSIPELKLK